MPTDDFSQRSSVKGLVSTAVYVLGVNSRRYVLILDLPV